MVEHDVIFYEPSTFEWCLKLTYFVCYFSTLSSFGHWAVWLLYSGENFARPQLSMDILSWERGGGAILFSCASCFAWDRKFVGSTRIVTTVELYGMSHWSIILRAHLKIARRLPRFWHYAGRDTVCWMNGERAHTQSPAVEITMKLYLVRAYPYTRSVQFCSCHM